MTQEALIAAIVLACKFNDVTISKEKKEICMENIVNCAVLKNGEISYQIFKNCEKKWQIK